MPTRFYFPSSGSAPVTPTLGTGWETTTGFSSHFLAPVKSNTTRASGTARAKSVANTSHDRLDRVFVSSRLAPQTISGTFSMVIPGLESSTALDAFLQVMIRVISSDGATVRATLYAGSASTAVSTTVGAENQEFGTSVATRIKSAIALTSYTCIFGDRISVEIGYRSAASSTTSTSVTLTYGDPSGTADYALTADLTTTLVPWIEFSTNLVPGELGEVLIPGLPTVAESDMSATMTVAKPANLANGDVLIFVNTWSFDGADPAAPAEGFTSLGIDKSQISGDATSPHVRISAKPITNASGEPTNYIMSASLTGNNVGVMIPLRNMTALFTNLVALELLGTPTPNSSTHTIVDRSASVVPQIYIQIFSSQFYTTSKNTVWTIKPEQSFWLGQISSVFNNVLVCAEIDTVAGSIGTRQARVSQTGSAGKTASIGLRSASAPTPAVVTQINQYFFLIA